MKLAGYFITGVMALMAEALHTLSDIFVSGFLLVAAYYSRKAADQVHMFGYGRAQNVAALTAAILFISFLLVRASISISSSDGLVAMSARWRWYNCTPATTNPKPNTANPKTSRVLEPLVNIGSLIKMFQNRRVSKSTSGNCSDGPSSSAAGRPLRCRLKNARV